MTVLSPRSRARTCVKQLTLFLVCWRCLPRPVAGYLLSRLAND